MDAQIDLLLKNNGNSYQSKPWQRDVFPSIKSPVEQRKAVYNAFKENGYDDVYILNRKK